MGSHTNIHTQIHIYTEILITYYKHVFVSKLLASCIYFPSYNFHAADYNKSHCSYEVKDPCWLSVNLTQARVIGGEAMRLPVGRSVLD